MASAWSTGAARSDAPTADATPLTDAAAPASALKQVVGLVLGQLGAVTALAFYFGWARTSAFLQYFGVDTSVVGLTTTDYVLRSVGAAYWPLMVLGVLVVTALTLHPRISAHAAGSRRWLVALTAAGTAMLAVAAAGLFQLWIFPPSIPVIPLLITTGLALLTYVSLLRANGRATRSGLHGKAQFVALAGLVAGGLFWLWGTYAAAGGRSTAEDMADDLPYRTEVAVFSAQRLGLNGPGIRVDPIPDDTSAYQFRYTGLRLLLHSGDRYFLLPKDWQHGRDPLFVLVDSDTVRLQFVASPFD